MYKNRFRGFTLIELLVVIAIIGILSAVVLATLNAARLKGNDAAIQANLSTIQTQAEVYYGTNNGYGAFAGVSFVSNAAPTAGDRCAGGSSHVFKDPTIKKALDAADAANGAGNIGCSANGQSYIVAVELNAPSPPAYWCLDSSGKARQVAGSVPSTPLPALCPN